MEAQQIADEVSDMGEYANFSLLKTIIEEYRIIRNKMVNNQINLVGYDNQISKATKYLQMVPIN